MNKSSIAILSFALLFIVSCSRNDASYTVEDRIISTYPFSDPNPIPILTKDKRLYPYHAFVGYKESPFSSETINIDNDGYRISRNNSDKPDIYFLGGSTMFGYGSDDMNSIPSLFSKLTDDSLSVRNMGNADHSSTQSL